MNKKSWHSTQDTLGLKILNKTRSLLHNAKGSNSQWRKMAMNIYSPYNAVTSLTKYKLQKTQDKTIIIMGLILHSHWKKRSIKE